MIDSDQDDSLLDLLRLLSHDDNANFAKSSISTWTCICGTVNTHSSKDETDECKVCARGKDQMLASFTCEAILRRHRGAAHGQNEDELHKSKLPGPMLSRGYLRFLLTPRGLCLTLIVTAMLRLGYLWLEISVLGNEIGRLTDGRENYRKQVGGGAIFQRGFKGYHDEYMRMGGAISNAKKDLESLRDSQSFEAPLLTFAILVGLLYLGYTNAFSGKKSAVVDSVS